MNIGDWVHFLHQGQKHTGFILEAAEHESEVQITIPKDCGIVKVATIELIPGDSVIWMDDIPVMIDLSLKIRDEQWFIHWVHELSLWKPIETLMGRQ